eukprot:CAMPEP_0118692794 /NCGR_PEP_ID=MMETSP0800-20121206/11508_1 /TAXON_ID=210618 ORGANISM="Striatella unipunctata, Strain CCMP2910" /NCGR_SAMPLE_ID=MMETSP0800 /ASSEMBLY_ACC=CAM_ASM_000638 /LENGTH=370 /DNA_ID=CAMNT_0006590873 /DNA_START=87 /DNA_END=1199 /DNA_ORIENTATION=-
MNCGSKTYSSGEVPAVFLGCYVHSAEHTLPFQYIPGPEEGSMTNFLCIKGCGQNSYDHAGLWNGNQCFCGYAVHLTATPSISDTCTMDCEGDLLGVLGSCGASGHTSVYEVPEKDIVSLSSDPVYSYVGCYSNFVGDVQQKQDEQMTIDMCVKECEANGYESQLAVIEETKCTCTNVANLPKRAVSPTECSTNCNGDSSIKCGGPDAGSVYQVLMLNVAETSDGSINDATNTNGDEQGANPLILAQTWCTDEKNSDGAVKNYLDPDEKLLTTVTLVSENGDYTFNVKNNGKFVMKNEAAGSKWTFGERTAAKSSSPYLFMELSGDLVAYDKYDNKYWSSDTSDQGNFALLTNEGSLIIYGSNCEIREEFS